MDQQKIKFPLKSFGTLITNITGYKIDQWIKFWENEKSILLYITEYYGDKFNYDWLWGVVLPILSDIYNLRKSSINRKVIGLSALPGTGKTTLGLLLKKICLKMNIKLTVVSMDDFYLPFNEMKIFIKDNPWHVSRGFPGSHSVSLMENKILEWKKTGRFDYPIFDKSLRKGLGDRSSWNTSFPEIIILEGWFLGVKPICSNNITLEKIIPPLSKEEISYREKIDNNLCQYLKIWKLVDKIWQIKPNKFSYMNKWKVKQENTMFIEKGNALVDEKLLDFLRMLNCSIPQNRFEEIDANYKIILNKNRTVEWVGINN